MAAWSSTCHCEWTAWARRPGNAGRARQGECDGPRLLARASRAFRAAAGRVPARAGQARAHAARLLAALIPDAQLHVVRGAGTCSCSSRPTRWRPWSPTSCSSRRQPVPSLHRPRFQSLLIAERCQYTTAMTPARSKNAAPTHSAVTARRSGSGAVEALKLNGAVERGRFASGNLLNDRN